MASVLQSLQSSQTFWEMLNTKQAFQKVKTLTGCEPKPTCSVSDPETHTKELNTFFTCFDNQDFSSECQALLRALSLPDPEKPAPFTEEEVRHQLSRCKPGKAPGPDGIPARVLKTCAMELSEILLSLFCQSYRTATIPTLWKTTTIIPVPKKPRPTEPNHYCPIALTSMIIKCLKETAAEHHSSTFHPTPRPPPICLQGKEGHRGCCGLSAAPPAPAPGFPRQLRQDPLCGLELCLRLPTETPADPEVTSLQHPPSSDPSDSQLPH